ncbi:hypothetical protein [Dyadobacter psychrotolerans]|uniref:DUF4386 family protein n=1 Tax=Dyadobacter psychrotolerans TaxID=2541721 RepID=A0A4R5DY15_9BACT|nr:hypothetical protein [Dyadobacter psychrotolerans]TDE17081.1 hypothetical protein E0F88_04050 [Dyadobacter psychrotolerans]
MHNQKLYRNISQAYLSMIPIVTAVLGFTLNNVSYQTYLPIWLTSAFLMMAASWILGARSFTNTNNEKQYLAVSGFLLVAPWIFFSIFAGMGSPPETYAEWVSNAFEQQVRYAFLITGGVLLTFGFAVLRDGIKDTSGRIFSIIGFTAIAIAMTFFILDMGYWHSFLLETFKTKEAVSLNKLPEWHKPVQKLFLLISIVEVSLAYLATAAFVASLKSAGWLKNNASRIYIVISLLAFILVSLYGFYPEKVTNNGFPFYPFMIPAIPFVMPFYIGVNLLRRAGN